MIYFHLLLILVNAFIAGICYAREQWALMAINLLVIIPAGLVVVGRLV